MIQLFPEELPERVTQKLSQWQAEIDNCATFEEKVNYADKSFSNKNKPQNKIFEKIRNNLLSVSGNTERCHYCEDSKADEVEHIAPKSWYPEKCFVWGNYCIACGPCNGPKNNQFAIFQNDDTISEFPKRKKNDPILPPPAGRPVLINPRNENPLDFFYLDILESTFFIVPSADDGTEEFKRAEYTIRVLALNKRTYLVKARQNAYANYKARLREYITERDHGATNAKLQKMIHGIREEGHPTVWAEMKRQYHQIDEIQPLFEQIQLELTQEIF